MIKNRARLTRRQDILHDLAEESTNGDFANAPDEPEKDRKKNHDLVNDFIKSIKIGKVNRAV